MIFREQRLWNKSRMCYADLERLGIEKAPAIFEPEHYLERDENSKTYNPLTHNADDEGL